MTSTETRPARPRLLTTAEVARRCEVHRDTVWDWITAGVDGPGGARVFLDARKYGGHWKVTEEQLEAFLRACDPRGRAPVAPESGAKARKRAEDDVRRAREALGRPGR